MNGPMVINHVRSQNGMIINAKTTGVEVMVEKTLARIHGVINVNKMITPGMETDAKDPKETLKNDLLVMIHLPGVVVEVKGLIHHRGVDVITAVKREVKNHSRLVRVLKENGIISVVLHQRKTSMRMLIMLILMCSIPG